MSEKITYYKVIGPDNKSCHGGDFDWTDYLPQGDNPGIWTPEIKNIEECSCGYHITRYWNMWYKDECRIFECEVKGLVTTNQTGVIEKEVATSIRLVRERVLRFDKIMNTGNMNTGHRNTGNSNTGKWNTGNMNTGHWNTGNRNSGDMNTGHWNSGYRNSGDMNTGHRNSGNGNSGNWNTANKCNGHFNTITPDTIMVFNKPCRTKEWDGAILPSFLFHETKGTYLESWRSAYDGATNDEKLLLVRLPNFDADVFYEISGIRVDPENGQEVK